MKTSPTAAIGQASVAERPRALPPVKRSTFSWCQSSDFTPIQVRSITKSRGHSERPSTGRCALVGHIPQPAATREAIAKAIVEAATQGERDLYRLRDAGLAAVSHAGRVK